MNRSLADDTSHSLQVGKTRPTTVAFMIGWRYLTGAASMLSAVSIAAVVGLALSVAVLIIVLSVINGFERELRERLLGVTAHATVWLKKPAPLSAMRESILLEGTGITGVAPVIEEAALASSGDKVTGVLVTGIDPERHPTVSDLHRYLEPVQGTLRPGEFDVWLGQRLARKLGVGVGDAVTLVLPTPVVSPVGLLPRQRRFTVSALVNTQSEMDGRGAFIHLADAGRLFRIGSRTSGYQVRLDDVFATDHVWPAAELAFGDEVASVRPWSRVQGNLYQAIVTQKITMFVLLSFLVAVAAFNLVSGLMMVADQKRADVAILRSMGSSTAVVMRLFLIVGLLLGFAGLLTGVVAGVLLTLVLPDALMLLSGLSGRDLMSQYFIGYLPVDIRAGDIGLIVGISLLLVLMAALFPAWKATRQKPVAILAHE
jgi:lipoprotein-releasing system permease protein